MFRRLFLARFVLAGDDLRLLSIPATPLLGGLFPTCLQQAGAALLPASMQACVPVGADSGLRWHDDGAHDVTAAHTDNGTL